MATIRKNGKAYDSGDVVVNLLGQQEDEVYLVSYSVSQEHQHNFSLANDATSWSMGKKTPVGKLGLYMNAARKLEAISGGDMLRIAPGDMNITFLNEFNEIVNDTVVFKFASQGREVNGEMGLKYEYDIFVLGIKFHN